MPRGGRRPGAGRRKSTEPPAALDGLPPRKQRYLLGRLEGKSKRQAAIAAGYSQHVADNAAHSIETPAVLEALRKLVRRYIPAEKIIQRISEGLDATETKFFQKDGRVIEMRDVVAWGERREYLKLAAEYGGYHDPKQPLMPPPSPDGPTIYRALGQQKTTTTVRQVTELIQERQTETAPATEGPSVLLPTEPPQAGPSNKKDKIIVEIQDY